jgi:hypothetical protein
MIYKKRSVKIWEKRIKKIIINYFQNKHPDLDENKIIVSRVYKVEKKIIKARFRPFYVANIIVHFNQDFRSHLRLQITLPFRKRKFKFKILEEHSESSAFRSLSAIAHARESMKKTKIESKKYEPCFLSAKDLRRRIILLSS